MEMFNRLNSINYLFSADVWSGKAAGVPRLNKK
jgi:hypothetical protein